MVSFQGIRVLQPFIRRLDPFEQRDEGDLFTSQAKPRMYQVAVSSPLTSSQVRLRRPGSAVSVDDSDYDTALCVGEASVCQPSAQVDQELQDANCLVQMERVPSPLGQTEQRFDRPLDVCVELFEVLVVVIECGRCGTARSSALVPVRGQTEERAHGIHNVCHLLYACQLNLTWAAGELDRVTLWPIGQKGCIMYFSPCQSKRT